MLKTSIDELTVVLQATVKDKLSIESNADWQKLANEIIADFEEKSDLETAFGKKAEAQKCPEGYTIGHLYGNHSFYFCVAFNQENYSMGIIVKFSAQALAYYLKTKKMQVYDFWR